MESSLKISANGQKGLILGTAQLTRTYGVLGNGFLASERESPSVLLHNAERFGFNGIDTAPNYGKAETAIGQFQTSLPVYSKIDPDLDPITSVRLSLKRLRKERIEGFFLHEELTMSREQRKTLKSLNEMKGELLSVVGVSIYSIEEYLLARDSPLIDVIQLPYNLFDRRFSANFLSSTDSEHQKIFSRSPLLQGLLTQNPSSLPAKFDYLGEGLQTLNALSQQVGTSQLNLALQFVLDNEMIDAIVIGTSNSAEQSEIVSSCRTVMSTEIDWAREVFDFPDWPLSDPRDWD
jgi:aryl-alcohol dehydrogenase-like predicted oxidoreductase